MNKREFLKKTAIISAGVAVYPLISCHSVAGTTTAISGATLATGPLKITLPPLGYAFNALEPSIDALTMEIHYSKHHQAYIDKLNPALEANPEFASLHDVRRFCSAIATEHTALRNHGGGHINHSMFWNLIAPGGSKAPVGSLLDLITSSFGSHEEFAKQFSDAAKSRFGSGWAWLVYGKDGKLFVSSTANQDNPLMSQLIDKPGEPILGIDVWEHAYYLHYQNKRADYINAFMGIINWDNVTSNLSRAANRTPWEF